MKRPNAKTKQERRLERQLELVRLTVRVLTPIELEHVNGGTETTGPLNSDTGCNFWPFTG